MRQGTISEFEQGRLFGRQELLISILHNASIRKIREDDIYISLDNIQRILKEETDRNGELK